MFAEMVLKHVEQVRFGTLWVVSVLVPKLNAVQRGNSSIFKVVRVFVKIAKTVLILSIGMSSNVGANVRLFRNVQLVMFGMSKFVTVNVLILSNVQRVRFGTEIHVVVFVITILLVRLVR